MKRCGHLIYALWIAGCGRSQIVFGSGSDSHGGDDDTSDGASTGDDGGMSDGEPSGGASASGSGEGDTASDPCGGETPLHVWAFHDAVERTEVSIETIAADVDAVRNDLAAHLGLAEGASDEEIIAAIAATYAASIQPGGTLRVGAVRCSGSLDAARENLAICLPGVSGADVTFACEGDCSISSPDECPEARCLGPNDACGGACTGTCELVGAACDGICVGTCDGACECEDDSGCAGRCDGACTGTCELVAASCGGTCAGTCIESDPAACDGAWTCATVGFACAIDCSDWATPIDVGRECETLAVVAGAASMTCDVPFASLQYASTSCSDFASTATVFESAAGRLARDLEHLELHIFVQAPAVMTYVDALIAADDLSACVVQTIFDRVESFATAIGEGGLTLVEIDALATAISPP